MASPPAADTPASPISSSPRGQIVLSVSSGDSPHGDSPKFLTPTGGSARKTLSFFGRQKSAFVDPENKSGRLGDLSAHQEKVLGLLRDRFKKNVAPDGLSEKFRLDDRQLLCFARARNFDFDKTAEMIHAHLKWRADWKPHTVTVDTPGVAAVLKSGFVRLRMPDDRFKFSIILITIANYHPSEFKSEDEMVRAVIYVYQTVYNAMFKSGFNPDQVIMLVDAKSWTLAHSSAWSMRLIRGFLSTAQQNYPESLLKAYLVGSPKIFAAAWTVIKGWMDPIVAAKFILVDESFDALYELIPSEVLLKRIGGSTSSDDEWPCPGGLG